MTRAWVAGLAALAAAAMSPGASRAQDIQPAPNGAVYDATFTRFSLRNHQESNGGQPVDAGWELEVTARMVGENIPDQSALIFRLRQGGNELGRTRCPLRTTDFNPQVPWRGARNCHQDEVRIRAVGDVDVDVLFFDGATDAETLVWRHRIQVLVATRMRGTGLPDATQHYLNQNGEVLRAMIHRVPKGLTPYAEGSRNPNYNRVELMFMTAPSKWNLPRSNAPDIRSDLTLRCTVDGQPLAIERSEVRGSTDLIESMTHSFGGGGREEQEMVNYRWITLNLPLSWGEHRVSGQPVLEEHPGRWECVLRREGETVRGFSFTVQPDGDIAPHPEEQHLPIPYDTHLVDMTIPNTERFETRVDPASVRTYGIAYGHVLQSEASRAAVEALPTLGNATLPQPRPARGARGNDRGRGRRGR